MPLVRNSDIPAGSIIIIILNVFTDDGEFDVETFVQFVEDHVPIKTPEEIDTELINAFEKFDSNKNHLIDKDEFRLILTSSTMGDEPLTETEADELLAQLDVDGDGQLNVTGNADNKYNK